MKVYLKKDIERVGIKGELIQVSDGYARNYLLARGLAVEVTPKNQSFYESNARSVEHRKEVIASETSILAEKISSLKVTIKRKLHDDGKLYGSVSNAEIADALQIKGVNVTKNKIKIDKSIKEKGEYNVTVKLTSRLQPKIKVQVISE